MQEIFAALLLPASVALGISLVLGAVCPALGGVSARILMAIFVLIILYACWDLIVGIIITIGLWIAGIAAAVVAILMVIRFVRWISQRI